MGGADPITAFLDRLASTSAALLALDYDGTLAPFRIERDQAVPLPGVADALDGIRRETATRVVIVSGRSSAAVAQLLGLDPAPEIWGSHGWERRLPDGRHEIAPLPPAARVAVEQIAHSLADNGFEDLMERKASGVALHWRGVDPGRAAAARAAAAELWDALPDAHGPLTLLAFNHGIEFRGTGHDKGTAMRTLLGEVPPETAVAYVGDDLTDEDAFTALQDVGLGVLVAATPRSTRAIARLASSMEVLKFLERWRRAAPHHSAPLPHTTAREHRA
jgi:trehalose 6-phosphate phosphatase